MSCCILAPFLLEAVEASLCYFLEKLVYETQMSKPLEPTRCYSSRKLLILLALRVIYFRSFYYKTPCTTKPCHKRQFQNFLTSWMMKHLLEFMTWMWYFSQSLPMQKGLYSQFQKHCYLFLCFLLHGRRKQSKYGWAYSK